MLGLFPEERLKIFSFTNGNRVFVAGEEATQAQSTRRKSGAAAAPQGGTRRGGEGTCEGRPRKSELPGCGTGTRAATRGCARWLSPRRGRGRPGTRKAPRDDGGHWERTWARIRVSPRRGFLVPNPLPQRALTSGRAGELCRSTAPSTQRAPGLPKPWTPLRSFLSVRSVMTQAKGGPQVA